MYSGPGMSSTLFGVDGFFLAFALLPYHSQSVDFMAYYFIGAVYVWSFFAGEYFFILMSYLLVFNVK